MRKKRSKKTLSVKTYSIISLDNISYKTFSNEAPNRQCKKISNIKVRMIILMC